ncbi:HNH endonuclease [Hymenobacter gummosus]|uniref:HNH endonuclease n=1 Tax=Hymenobacter gummosus TaxID=1776032 RepID=A0A3S0H2S4_9BACT|nr:HNH endonuclease signature motif containing protein [Hymenobacter gummosus]RTQ45839.1 HNH endonuclease [Hymenobacter gummosus]
MPHASSSRFASEQLAEGQIYTIDELQRLLHITDATIGREVFRPSGYNSVWLSITGQQPGQEPHSQLIDGNTLIWRGQPAGRNDHYIITHELSGLELLVFYRETPGQYSGGGYRYLGRFEYHSHSGAHPALFTLARSGTIPSLAEVQARQDKEAGFNPATIRDGREWVLASIVRRRGQAAFRNSLLAAYDSTCPVTGCQVEPLLEAAHIIPYLGPSTNHVQNGLPLRADIHTLFDLQLLAIDPVTLKVELSPLLAGSEYTTLAGQQLRLPASAANHPNRDALRAHRIRCAF